MIKVRGSIPFEGRVKVLLDEPKSEGERGMMHVMIGLDPSSERQGVVTIHGPLAKDGSRRFASVDVVEMRGVVGTDSTEICIKGDDNKHLLLSPCDNPREEVVLRKYIQDYWPKARVVISQQPSSDPLRAIFRPNGDSATAS